MAENAFLRGAFHAVLGLHLLGLQHEWRENLSGGLTPPYPRIGVSWGYALRWISPFSDTKEQAIISLPPSRSGSSLP